MNPRILVAMLGARRDYAIPRILEMAGWLGTFCTDLVRSNAGVTQPRTRQYPLFGLARVVRSRWATTPARRVHAYLAWNRKFCRLVAAGGLGNSTAVYAFNAAGLEIFEAAQERGLGTLLDQTAAPWSIEEPLVEEERRQWPGWEFEGTKRADWQPLADRETAEWAMSDLVICGSEYVARSVAAASGRPVKTAVVPYGVDPARFQAAPRPKRDQPLRVLFAGTVQLRKGIPYLADAARQLKSAPVQFRAVGPIRVSADAARSIGEHVTLAGPVPRSQIQHEYDGADVLVLPSLSEGSANVCYEALACGLPVITTPNAGSVVRDGVDGFIVPIRSAEAIAAKLERLAADRDLLATLSRNAAERALEFTQRSYAERLLAALEPVLVDNPT
jgi:glycosyltransferase involved in cell wall biosynthesis